MIPPRSDPQVVKESFTLLVLGLLTDVQTNNMYENSDHCGSALWPGQ